MQRKRKNTADLMRKREMEREKRIIREKKAYQRKVALQEFKTGYYDAGEVSNILKIAISTVSIWQRDNILDRFYNEELKKFGFDKNLINFIALYTKKGSITAKDVVFLRDYFDKGVRPKREELPSKKEELRLMRNAEIKKEKEKGRIKRTQPRRNAMARDIRGRPDEITQQTQPITKPKSTIHERLTQEERFKSLGGDYEIKNQGRGKISHLTPINIEPKSYYSFKEVKEVLYPFGVDLGGILTLTSSGLLKTNPDNHLLIEGGPITHILKLRNLEPKALIKYLGEWGIKIKESGKMDSLSIRREYLSKVEKSKLGDIDTGTLDAILIDFKKHDLKKRFREKVKNINGKKYYTSNEIEEITGEKTSGMWQVAKFEIENKGVSNEILRESIKKGIKPGREYRIVSYRGDFIHWYFEHKINLMTKNPLFQ